MASRRLAPVLVLLLSTYLAAGPAPATAQSTGDTVVFWGRNTEQNEGSLKEACDTGLYTTVIISFLSAFGRGGTPKLDISGHPVSAVGADIKHCQSKGILVLLAIGGQGGEYSLPSSQAAVDLDDYLWNAFLLGRGRQGITRPFGDASVDGIDFFIDQGATEHYDELARLLNAHNKECRGRPCVTLTATARCGYPDQRLQAALSTRLFSRIHVKVFGDGRCAARREELEKWAAAYPESRILVGIVASPEADPQSYLSHKDLYYDVLQFINKLPNYGGLMIWNRYWDKKTGWTAGNEP